MLYVSLKDQITLNCFTLLLKRSVGPSILLNSLGLSSSNNSCWCSKAVVSQSLIICSKLIADLLFVYEFVFFGSSSSFSTSILREHVSLSTNACLILLE